MSYSYAVQHSSLWSTRGYYGYDSTPTGITIHWWGRMGQDHDNVANFLCRKGGNTSAHEVISDGRVTHLIDFDRASWHSGSTEGNGTTIGLECRPEMTAGDLETVAQRCADIEDQLGKSMYYYGHSDWYATACPGTWYEQIGWIVTRVNEIHAGQNPKEDDMPDRKEFEQWVHNGFLQALRNPEVRKQVLRIVWHDTTVSRGGAEIPALQELADAKSRAMAAEAKLAGLSAALEAGGLDAERVEQIVREAVKQSIEITGTVNVSASEEQE